MNIYSVFYIVIVFYYVENAKILGVYPYTSFSHYQFGNTIFKELVKRGHQVTVITPFKENNVPENYSQIVVDDLIERNKEIRKTYLDHINYNIFQKVHWMDTLGINFTKWTLSHPKVNKLLQEKRHFDLVIFHQMMSDAYNGFCYHFNAQCIAITSMTAPNWVYKKIGNTMSPSYVPQYLVNYPAKMNFYQRFYNTFVYIVLEISYYCYLYPNQSRLLRKYFPEAPPLDDLYYNTSLILINSHVSVDDVCPSLPNLIHIAGAHIKESETLPLNLQTYLDNAAEGVIFFSLGSNVNSKDLSEHKRNGILKVFSGLKEKVLWKWEERYLPNKSDNVMIGTWFPQQAILAHPKVKLFISHGGMMSTIEAVYYGVPVLGIPVFADQGLNMARAEEAGYGKRIFLEDLNEEVLHTTLHEMLSKPRYKKNAERISMIFKDQPIKPLDNAMFWIEYVLRHRGAPHLRSAALQLTWYQYHLLDVTFVAFATLVAAVFILKFIMCFILKLLHAKEKKDKIKQT